MREPVSSRKLPFETAAALGDLELKAGRAELAAEHFKVALLLARNPTERRFFRQRLGACAGSATFAP